jgi:hypothetical protein
LIEEIEYDAEEKIYYSVKKISKDEYIFEEKEKDSKGNFIIITRTKYKTKPTLYRYAARDSLAIRVIRRKRLEEDGVYVDVEKSDEEIP